MHDSNRRGVDAQLAAQKLPHLGGDGDNRVGLSREQPLGGDVAPRLVGVDVVLRRDHNRRAGETRGQAAVQIGRLQVRVDDRRPERAHDPDEARERDRMPQPRKAVDREHRHAGRFGVRRAHSALRETADRLIEARPRQSARGREHEPFGAADAEARDDVEDADGQN